MTPPDTTPPEERPTWRVPPFGPCTVLWCGSPALEQTDPPRCERHCCSTTQKMRAVTLEAFREASR